MTDGVDTGAPFPLPRVTIKFCTQCKWMLRAAYYAQELLSTFSTSLGEVALQPSTGGTFVVEIFHSPSNTTTTLSSSSSSKAPQPGSDPPPTAAGAAGDGGGISPARTVLWDRKTDGGFPETKELKRRVRDVIEPVRDLGHVDRNHARPSTTTATTNTTAAAASEPTEADATEAQQQQPQPQPQPQKDKPSRAKLEAAGTAGAGYPGASEAAAEATAAAAAAACESRKECEDCG